MSEGASKNTSRSNWARVDALTNEETDTSDAPALSEAFFQRAHWRKPARVRVTIRVDPDVLAWFEAEGEEPGPRMTAALRIDVEAHCDS
jgi:uncharacterized protein (DUF4415 family)